MESSLLTWYSNLVYSFAIKLDSTSHAYATLMDFKQPIRWIRWLVFMDKYQLVHILYLKMTFSKCNQNVNNIQNVFCIYLIGWMPNICCVSITKVINLFCSLCHQDKAHLQFSTSTTYQHNSRRFLDMRSLKVFAFVDVV